MTTAEILALLKKENDFISGEELSRLLRVSRTAVWKAVKNLRSEGYVIEALTNRGYRLADSSGVLNAEELRALLKTAHIGRRMVFKSETDSTNADARRAYESGAPHGSVFFAEKQRSGSGRMGRGWADAPGEGLAMSVLLRPEIAPGGAMQVTLLAGLAVNAALNGLTGLPCKIKWPNDIFIGSKKVCGILCTMSAETDRVHNIIAGIGINVNNKAFPEELRESATSLLLESGKKYPRAAVAAGVLNEFEPLYDLFVRHGMTAATLDSYRQSCMTLGKNITAEYGREKITGRAEGISLAGELLVSTKMGVRALSGGEAHILKS